MTTLLIIYCLICYGVGSWLFKPGQKNNPYGWLVFISPLIPPGLVIGAIEVAIKRAFAPAAKTDTETSPMPPKQTLVSPPPPAQDPPTNANE